jgi:hypothetical protein
MSEIAMADRYSAVWIVKEVREARKQNQLSPLFIDMVEKSLWQFWRENRNQTNRKSLKQENY